MKIKIWNWSLTSDLSPFLQVIACVRGNIFYFYMYVSVLLL